MNRSIDPDIRAFVTLPMHIREMHLERIRLADELFDNVVEEFRRLGSERFVKIAESMKKTMHKRLTQASEDAYLARVREHALGILEDRLTRIGISEHRMTAAEAVARVESLMLEFALQPPSA